MGPLAVEMSGSRVGDLQVEDPGDTEGVLSMPNINEKQRGLIGWIAVPAAQGSIAPKRLGSVAAHGMKSGKMHRFHLYPLSTS